MPRARASRWTSGRLGVFAATVAVSLTAGASCSSSEPGLEVDVLLAPPASPALTNGERRFSTDEGYDVTITRGYLAIGSVELEPCPAEARSFTRSLGVGVAYAHSVTSPTRLGNPGVISLGTTADDELLLGTLKPPPGDYCSVRVGLTPADEDAAALPSDVDFVGLTLFLEGSYGKGAEQADFRAASGTELEVTTLMEPLTLDDGSSSKVRLTLGSRAEHWFDGIDFSTATSGEIADGVLDNVKPSLTVTSR